MCLPLFSFSHVCFRFIFKCTIKLVEHSALNSTPHQSPTFRVFCSDFPVLLRQSASAKRKKSPCPQFFVASFRNFNAEALQRCCCCLLVLRHVYEWHCMGMRQRSHSVSSRIPNIRAYSGEYQNTFALSLYIYWFVVHAELRDCCSVEEVEWEAKSIFCYSQPPHMDSCVLNLWHLPTTELRAISGEIGVKAAAHKASFEYVCSERTTIMQHITIEQP